MQTREYYETQAEAFKKRTWNVDMTHIYERFLKYLPKNGKVLDAGCGPGRDVCFFLSKGFDVHGIDRSESMVKLAQKECPGRVSCESFDQIDFDNDWDAIWACCSLLHVEKKNMNALFKRMIKSLKQGGVWYFSFKEGAGERTSGDRFYNDYSVSEMRSFIKEFPSLDLQEIWVCEDPRLGNHPQFLNVIVSKT